MKGEFAEAKKIVKNTWHGEYFDNLISIDGQYAKKLECEVEYWIIRKIGTDKLSGLKVWHIQQLDFNRVIELPKREKIYKNYRK